MNRSNLFPAALLLLCGNAFSADDSAESLVERARTLHDEIISIDTHVDIGFDFATETNDPGRDSVGQIDLPKLDKSGQTGAVFAIFVSQDKRTAENYRKAHTDGLTKLRAIRRMAEFYPSRIEIAESPADVRRIHADGKHVAVIGMLNGFPLGPNAENLDEYVDAGLRQVGFTHAGNNDLADSSRPQLKYGDEGPEHGGLSEAGKALVTKLNQRGVIVDVSQLTPAALSDAVQASAVPVVASHSAVMAIVPHPRNLSDESMKEIADRGGVVSIVAFGGYLREIPFDFPTEAEKIQAKYNVGNDLDVEALDSEKRTAYDADMMALLRRIPPATIADYVDAIDYAVDLVGIDHVGIATDFNHGGRLVGWANASESHNITAELLRRGYDETAVAKLWAENWLRVFETATEYARRMENPRHRSQLNSVSGS